MILQRLLIGVALLILLSACAGPRQRPPPADADGPPRRSIDVSSLREPQPRVEPRARYGNHSPYTVNGREYHVLASASGYHERGLASWYGRKFHGRRTSSGEPFDMHQISAAHRSLPLPTYVEITNLDNGRQIIARVNDRGPFHSDRIIDLSYAAALKLGFADQGTARVEVRAINLEQAETRPASPVNTGGSDGELTLIEPTWLQVGAFSDLQRALEVLQLLHDSGLDPVTLVSSRESPTVLHRVRLGPFRQEQDVAHHASRLSTLGFHQPVRISLQCQPRNIGC
ncbi:MAG: septal ring lytic transglycosylase RlpA family protein [Wenzhouxiangellaceae bacterium]